MSYQSSDSDAVDFSSIAFSFSSHFSSPTPLNLEYNMDIFLSCKFFWIFPQHTRYTTLALTHTGLLPFRSSALERQPCNLQSAASQPDFPMFLDYAYRVQKSSALMDPLVQMAHQKSQMMPPHVRSQAVWDLLYRYLSTQSTWSRTEMEETFQWVRSLLGVTGVGAAPITTTITTTGPAIAGSYANVAASNNNTTNGYPAVHHQAIPMQPMASSYAPSTPSSPYFMRCHFFPSEDSFQALMGVLSSAKRTLDICVYTITDNDVANAVVAAHRRCVQVRVISDDEQAKSLGSDIARFQEMGLAVRLDQRETHIHMHNKFCIVDGSVVLNGSYNWTKNARQCNNENFVVTNDPGAVQAFGAEFNKLWQEFTPTK